MKIKKAFFCIAIFLLQSINTFSQSLNIQETIDYINEKLENNKDVSDEHGKYVWEVSSDGKLTITKYWYNKVSSTYTVYLNELNENGVLIGGTSPKGLPYYIQVYTKNDKKAVNYKSDDTNSNTSFFAIIFKDDADVAKQLKNAIVNLIKKSKQSATFRKKDPFDY